MDRPVELIIIGAGDRGNVYAKFAEFFPEKAKIVGVAEPREFQRNKLAKIHSIPKENIYNDWNELKNRSKFADAVVIATQDSMHLEPVEEFSNKKYHILCEKPMAPSLEDCEKIVEDVKKNKVMFTVGHVLQYTDYTIKLKEIVDSGTIGDIVNMQHLEPVGFWHQAHSFVRGNWRNEKESSFMLLAKSCHDIDWILHILNKKCKSVSSFGSLKHFRKENKPKNAADRCTNCPKEIEKKCLYSAKRIYLDYFDKGYRAWPIDIITDNISIEGILTALTDGPYGRCVYVCDNDVVDNQVVNFQFDDGATATFTMTAFSEIKGRTTRIFGTKGTLEGDSRYITHYNLETDKTKKIDTKITNSEVLQGHGGGDFGIMKNFIDAVQNEDPSLITSGQNKTLASHQLVFYAEIARLENRVINIPNIE